MITEVYRLTIVLSGRIVSIHLVSFCHNFDDFFGEAFENNSSICYTHTARDLSLTPTNIGDGPTGSTSSSSGGSCSSTGGLTNNSPREAHVRLLLQPEVDQRRRQSARSLRLGVDTLCVFDERFKFPVSHDHLADKTLRFQVIKVAT